MMESNVRFKVLLLKLRNIWLQNILFLVLISFGMILITRPLATALVFIIILVITLVLSLESICRQDEPQQPLRNMYRMHQKLPNGTSIAFRSIRG